MRNIVLQLNAPTDSLAETTLSQAHQGRPRRVERGPWLGLIDIPFRAQSVTQFRRAQGSHIQFLFLPRRQPHLLSPPPLHQRLLPLINTRFTPNTAIHTPVGHSRRCARQSIAFTLRRT